MRRALIALCMALAAGGCGFHLAGSRATDLGDIALVYEQRYRVVPPPIIDALDVRLADEKAGEPIGRLVIRDVNTFRRVSAVSPVDAHAAAYELVTTIEYDFMVDGHALLENQSLTRRREYSFNNSQRLAAAAERRALVSAMQTRLAELILLRVRIALQKNSGQPR